MYLYIFTYKNTHREDSFELAPIIIVEIFAASMRTMRERVIISRGIYLHRWYRYVVVPNKHRTATVVYSTFQKSFRHLAAGWNRHRYTNTPSN